MFASSFAYRNHSLVLHDPLSVKKMPITRIQLDTDLHKILITSSFDDFTVLQLRDEYQILTNSKIPNASDARRYVYAQLKRLVQKGLLVKEKRVGQSKYLYKKTNHFYESDLYPKEQRAYENAKKPINKSQCSDDASIFLYSKLKRYKLELLTAIGESDEYESLYSELPSMGDELKARYRQSKDYSSKMLGKVKAIESLIEQLPL